MPIKEEPPFQEGRGEDGRGDNEEEEYTPLWSEFNSPLNLLQWRMDALGPRLNGPEKDQNASHDLMLNGSEQFMQVYGGGGQAAAFHGWVGETFAFVTNVTPYNQSGRSENSDVAQSSDREAADMDAVSGEGDGDTPLVPASMDLPAPRRTESGASSSEQGNPVGVSREPLSPAAPPPASFPHDSQGGLHTQTGQPAPDMAEQAGEVGEESGEMGGQSALPSLAEHLFTPVMRSLPGRRIRSLPGRRCMSI